MVGKSLRNKRKCHFCQNLEGSTTNFTESEMVLKKNFIPEGEIKVGITSGASTPDKIVADVIEKLIAITK